MHTIFCLPRLLLLLLSLVLLLRCKKYPNINLFFRPTVLLCIQSCHFFVKLLPTLSTSSRFSTTGVESRYEVTAFTFALLKTGDWKPAARKGILATKGHDLSPLPEFCQRVHEKLPEGLENTVCCQYFNPSVSTERHLCPGRPHTLLQ